MLLERFIILLDMLDKRISDQVYFHKDIKHRLNNPTL